MFVLVNSWILAGVYALDSCFRRNDKGRECNDASSEFQIPFFGIQYYQQVGIFAYFRPASSIQHPASN